MKKLIILFVLICLVFSYSFSIDYFRNTRWGMSVQDVLEAEESATKDKATFYKRYVDPMWTNNKVEILVFKGTFKGYSAFIFYRFKNDALYNAGYDITVKDSDKNIYKYFDVFEKLKDQYGIYKENGEIWVNRNCYDLNTENISKDDKREKCVVEQALMFSSLWIKSKTVIQLFYFDIRIFGLGTANQIYTFLDRFVDPKGNVGRRIYILYWDREKTGYDTGSMWSERRSWDW